MKKTKFVILAILAVAITLFAHFTNIPEMVDAQGSSLKLPASILFIAFSAVFTFICRHKKGVLVAGTVFWSISLLVALSVVFSVVSGIDLTFMIVGALIFNAPYFAIPALFDAPDTAYLLILNIIPLAELIYHIILLCFRKNGKTAETDNQGE